MRAALFLLSFAAFASAASMRVTDALLPRLASDFGVGIARAAAVVTGFTLAYGLVQVLYGPLGDHFGKLRVIAWGCGAAAVASLACWAAPTFEALVVARIVTGAFCACAIPLSLAWIGDVVAYDDRQHVLARFLLGQIFGLASGTAVGGFAADHANWRLPFLGLGIWFAVAAGLLAMAARHDPAAPGEGPRPREAGESIFANRWATVVVASVFTEGMLVFGVLAFIPTHLHYARGVELSHAGLALVAYAVGGALFALFARRIVRAFGEIRLSLGGAVLLAAGCATVAFAPDAAVAAAGCLVAGLGFYALHSTLQTNATQMAPSRRGAAMALFASLFFFGQSVGVAAAGFLAERYGTTVVILGAGLAVIPLGITFALLLRSRGPA